MIVRGRVKAAVRVLLTPVGLLAGGVLTAGLLTAGLLTADVRTEGAGAASEFPVFEPQQLGGLHFESPAGWAVSQAGGLILLSQRPGDSQAPSVLLRPLSASQDPNLEREIAATLQLAVASLGGRTRRLATAQLGVGSGSRGRVEVFEAGGARRPARVAAAVFTSPRGGGGAVALFAAPPDVFDQLHGVALSAWIAQSSVRGRESATVPSSAAQSSLLGSDLAQIFTVARNRPLAAGDQLVLERSLIRFSAEAPAHEVATLSQVVGEMQLSLGGASRNRDESLLSSHLLEFWLALARSNPLSPLTPAILDLLPAPSTSSKEPSGLLRLRSDGAVSALVPNEARLAVAVRLGGSRDHLAALWRRLRGKAPQLASGLAAPFEEAGLDLVAASDLVLSVQKDGAVSAVCLGEGLQPTGSRALSFPGGVALGSPLRPLPKVRPELPEQAPLLSLIVPGLDPNLRDLFPTLSSTLRSVRWEWLRMAPATFSVSFEFEGGAHSNDGMALLQWLSIAGLHAADETERALWRSVAWTKEPGWATATWRLSEQQEGALWASILEQLAQAEGERASRSQAGAEEELAAWVLRQWVEKNVILFGNPAGYRPL